MRNIWRHFTNYGDEYFLTGILVFLIIIAVNTQIGWLFAVSSLLASVLIISAILPGVSLSRIEIKRSIRGAIFEGEKFPVTLEVKNNSSISKYLIILKDIFPKKQDKKHKILLLKKLLPHKTKKLHYEEEADLRGVYYFTESIISCGAPFGFFWRRKKIPNPEPLVIYPIGPDIKKIPTDSFFQYQPSCFKTSKAKGESFNFMGARKYLPGDEIKFIHWPLTAKHNHLMLKEFNKPAQAQVNIMLDNFTLSSLGEGRENTLEYIIKIATSLCWFCFYNNIPFSIMAQDQTGFSRLPNPPAERFLNWLARILPEGKYNANFLLKNFEKNLLPGSQLFLLAAWPLFEPEILINILSQKVFVKIILLKGFSFDKNFKPQFNEINYEKAAAILKKLKIPHKTVSRGDDLKNCLLN